MASPAASLSQLRQLQRAKVLHLYRRIHKLGLTWQNEDDRVYIKEEAHKLFHDNMDIEDPELIDKKIFEAEARLELALHYGIPYPRPYFVPPKQAQKKMERIVPQYMHSGVPEDVSRKNTNSERLEPDEY